jgi:hypothetical protein
MWWRAERPDLSSEHNGALLCAGAAGGAVVIVRPARHTAAKTVVWGEAMEHRHGSERRSCSPTFAART